MAVSPGEYILQSRRTIENLTAYIGPMGRASPAEIWVESPDSIAVGELDCSNRRKRGRYVVIRGTPGIDVTLRCFPRNSTKY